MDLIEVDHVTAEPSQAVLALLADRAAFQRIVHLTGFVPDQSTLGKDIGPRSGPLRQSLRDDLLGMSKPIDGRRVDPVDPQFERPMNRRDRVGVLLGSPAKLPVSAPNRPSAKSDECNVKIRRTKFSCLHSSFEFTC